MQYDGLAWAVALVAMLALLVALRILLNTGWFLGWLRGTCGLAFLALAGLIGLAAYDLYSYSPLPQGKPLEIKAGKANEKFWIGFNDSKGRYLDNHIGKGRRHEHDPLWIRIEVVRIVVD